MLLRILRTQKRLTLARLGGETGLSTALLSKLETDRMIPTLPTLATICKVYGIGLSYFFREPERHTMSITRKAYLQGHMRDEPARIVPLNIPTDDARLRSEIIELTPSAPMGLSQLSGEACAVIVVMGGRLQLASGEATEFLDEGDCAYIHSTIALGLSAADQQPCRILVVRPGAAMSQA
jgi:transcriptional regulator with XRE-family HTH domain